MRVLLANTYHFLGGGISTYTFNMAALLREKGHEVAFFAMQHPNNLPDPNSDLFVSHIDYREMNVRRSVIDVLRVLARAIYSVEARQKFGQVVDRFQPDLVHLHGIHHHISPSIVPEAGRRGLPLVWTLHDYTLICPNSYCLLDGTGVLCEACGRNGYYKAILKRCKKNSIRASSAAAIAAYAHRLMGIRGSVDAFVAGSNFLRNKYLAHGFPEDKVHFLPNFLPVESFHLAEGDQGYLLYFGRLNHIKGIYQLLEAARAVPSIRLVLAGRLEEGLVADLPRLMPPNVHYAGMLTGSALREVVDGALAVVLPSLTHETSPHSLMEAFARGKPVIGSNTGGIAEVLKEGERGLLVQPGDVGALAEAMCRMAAQPSLAKTMGLAAYNYALEAHGQERFYAGLSRIYCSARLHRSSRGKALLGRNARPAPR